MKKYFWRQLILFGFSAITSLVSHGQFMSGNVASLDNKPQPENHIEATADADKIALEEVRAISAKMFAHFTRNYKGATRIRVSDLEGQTNIKFDMDGVSQTVRYDAKGKWAFSIRNYSEEKLDLNVRNTVETSYPGYMVFGFVSEIHILDKTAYLVMIESSKTWKRIRVVDGQASIYEEYNKPSR
jgi:hypothetical protein